MYYTVTVSVQGRVYSVEQVKGYQAAAEIDDYYSELLGYSVQIEPNVLGYIQAETSYSVRH